MIPSERHQTSQSTPQGFFVYVLLSLKDNGWYIGFTEDVKKRLIEHNKGTVFSTKDRIPFILIHYEYFINKADAKAREVFLKSGFGREQLKHSLKRTLLSQENFKFDIYGVKG